MGCDVALAAQQKHPSVRMASIRTWISKPGGSCRRPTTDSTILRNSRFPCILAPWPPGGMAPGRLETTLRDPPDPRTWLPGLAPGRPEMVPREDPADSGPGGQKRMGLQPQSLWQGCGGTIFWTTHCYKSFAFENPGPRARTKNSRYPGPSRDSRYPGPKVISHTGPGVGGFLAKMWAY